MKKRLIQALALFLAVLLLPLQAVAIDKREVINGIEIPEGWAYDALAFAVRNGILSGKENGALCPTDNATRAEMAAMVVRLTGAAEKADVSAFHDCPADAWFYSAMSQAVALGVLYGTSDSTLSPNQKLTREQAFTILARAFCLQNADPAVLESFLDRESISDFAKDAMAALVQAGYIRGADGRLNPKNNITRQELAQVIYGLVGAIVRNGSERSTEYRNLLFASDEKLAEGTVIHGDLLVACDAPECIDLTGVSVEGRVVLLRGCSRRLIGERFNEVYVHNDTVLDCSIGSLTVVRPELTVSILKDVEHTYVNGANVTLNGYGSAGKVLATAPYTVLDCAHSSLEEQVDIGLEGLRLTQTYTPLATYEEKKVRVSAAFEAVDTHYTYGVPESGRVCTLYWYAGSTLCSTTQNFNLTEGALASATLEIPVTGQSSTTYPASVKITYKNESKTFSLRVNVDKTGAVEAERARAVIEQAKAIRTIFVEATVRYTCTAANGRRIAEGTTVYYIKGGSPTTIQLADGTRTTVPQAAIRIRDRVYYDSSVNYSKEVAEAFVNVVHNYSSQGQYLIWCNLYSQRVFIFSGYTGHWKLIKSCQCASGKNESPTRPGIYTIFSRTYRWNFDDNYYYVLYPSLFDGGIAFHTRTRLSSNDHWLDSRLGCTITHGCVRMEDEYALWIYNNCKIGTKVVVW